MATTRSVAVTGATGLVGAALVPALRAQGWTVLTVGRDARANVCWNPATSALDAHALNGVEAIIHLAGSPIGERWTPPRRRAILESRVQGTALIAHAACALPVPPRVLVSASAIGVYGDRGDEILSETSAAGAGYLASVCEAWEGAATVARAAGIRVVHPRLGIVLSETGGALAKLLVPFRLGAGGPAGGGRQWMSWISLTDTVRALSAVLDDDGMSGAVNVVAPSPVTNAEFSQTLGRVLHRPAILPLPAFALELAFGEMARETLLASQRVQPSRLAAAGFKFEHASLDAALRAELRLVP